MTLTIIGITLAIAAVAFIVIGVLNRGNRDRERALEEIIFHQKETIADLQAQPFAHYLESDGMSLHILERGRPDVKVREPTLATHEVLDFTDIDDIPDYDGTT